MELAGKVVVVTGGGNGIGEGLVRRFVSEGAKVVAADLAGDAVDQVADEVGALAFTADVSVESDVIGLVDYAESELGPIDLFCSNAGIGPSGGLEMGNDTWQKIWEINTMSHVYAARACLPGMLARGEGYLLQTVSAAGLLTNLGAAAYSVTKHAALGLAEWISVTYGDRGIKVSALCPQFVQTDLLRDLAGDPAVAQWVRGSTIEVADVAEAVVRGLEEERFLILPHPEVETFFQRKASDYDRWLAGMRKLQASLGLEI
ncbi:MAG TPA: SDR family oxidoreductase [Acidimicrobiia bacterium]|nr:SDR family oxidoreductase [Acidimicrobiia bacterium]